MVSHWDLEDVRSHYKITLGHTPQILLDNTREVVTYCSHCFRRDGFQFFINDAVEHEAAPVHLNDEDTNYDKEGDRGGNVCRVYALQEVNFIYRDPEGLSGKMMFALLAHTDTGNLCPNRPSRQPSMPWTPSSPSRCSPKSRGGVKRAIPKNGGIPMRTMDGSGSGGGGIKWYNMLGRFTRPGG